MYQTFFYFFILNPLFKKIEWTQANNKSIQHRFYAAAWKITQG